MYRKPRFVPHYLPSLSDHPCAHKSGIFKCESYRAMLLSGTEEAYNKAIVDLFGFLEDAGYSARCFSKVSYDPAWRARALLKLANRNPDLSSNSGTSSQDRKAVFLALPFSTQASNLKIVAAFRSSVSVIIPIDLRLGWTIKPNTMRKLYRLNWPNGHS